MNIGGSMMCFRSWAPALTDQQLQLEGLMIWGQKGTSKEWVEPCSIRVSEATDHFGYEIRRGDALRGIGKVPYERRRKVTKQPLPDQWEFVVFQILAKCSESRKLTHLLCGGPGGRQRVLLGQSKEAADS